MGGRRRRTRLFHLSGRQAGGVVHSLLVQWSIHRGRPLVHWFIRKDYPLVRSFFKAAAAASSHVCVCVGGCEWAAVLTMNR